jgi:TonB family protein
VTTAERHALEHALGRDFRQREEQATLSSITQPHSSSPLAWLTTQPATRVPAPPAPGFVGSLLTAAGCQPSKRSDYGAVLTTFDADGRPTSAAVVDNLTPQHGCREALTALAHITLADDRYPITAGQSQLILLPLQPPVVACVDRLPFDAGATTAPLHAWELDTPVQRTKMAYPRYPNRDMSRQTQGRVVIDAVISVSGCVRSSEVVQSVDPELDAAATAGFMEWRFTPAVHDGQPREAAVTGDFNFTLH